MKNYSRKVLTITLFVFILSSGNGLKAYGALNPSNFVSDLNTLVISGSTLVATLEKITLSPFTMSTQLTSIENSVQGYLDSVGTLYKTVANSTDNTTLSLTNEMLVPLQTLSSIVVSLSQGLSVLSKSMTLLYSTTPLTIMNASLKSMLRLSDDIGVMADRILEMADKILIMADNIGFMADKILATQVIQSNNLKIVIDAMLQTQKNLLLLFGML